jgi:hypothetical protein
MTRCTSLFSVIDADRRAAIAQTQAECSDL